MYSLNALTCFPPGTERVEQERSPELAIVPDAQRERSAPAGRKPCSRLCADSPSGKPSGMFLMDPAHLAALGDVCEGGIDLGAGPELRGYVKEQAVARLHRQDASAAVHRSAAQAAGKAWGPLHARHAMHSQLAAKHGRFGQRDTP